MGAEAEGGGRLLGVRAAAEALGIAASTVSRYLQSHPDLNHGTRTRPKIDVAEFRLHRATYLPAGEAEAAPSARANTGAVAADLGEMAAARLAHERARAARADLDLRERLGQVVQRQAVEEAVYEAGQILRDGLARRARALGRELAALADPREIAARISAADRVALTEMARRFEALAETEESDAA